MIRYYVANALATPDPIPGSRAWVGVIGDRIASLGTGRPPGPVAADLGATTLAPGLVDIHCHGGGGESFADGASAAAGAAWAHLAHGTTTVIASLVSDSNDGLMDSIARLRPLVSDGVLGGIHLEGPWLSTRHCGAHELSHLRIPEPAEIEQLLAAGAGAIRMVTLAPELSGGLDAITQLTEAGVVAAIGHTDATYEQTRAAIDAGALLGTHLFNAMRSVHHREPGAALALLEHTDTVVELIADGVHVHPSVLRLAARAKRRRMVLVTDAMAAAAFRDGRFQLGSLDVEVAEGVARLSGEGTIAGSTLTLDAAMRYAAAAAGMDWFAALRAATKTPAEVLGLRDVGQIAPGFRADLVAFDEHRRVRQVMRAGKWVV